MHCTSWSFYGTVTQAARYGWPLPPTFLGAILFYAFAMAFMVRLVKLAHATNATSLADLIATRLGKDAWLAAVVTLVAALGLIPYIALQLKAVTMSFTMLTLRQVAAGPMPAWRDSALYVALALALFAMLFGTRRASATEHNRGLVLAMAFESLFKLAAMLALGVFVWFGLDAPAQAAHALPARSASGFAPLVVLGATAMFVLPHQFHVGVVECRDLRGVRTARWQFPLYLVLIALPALPLAQAGLARLGPEVPTDLYALALPFSQGREGLALFAFLGGLSAATNVTTAASHGQPSGPSASQPGAAPSCATNGGSSSTQAQVANAATMPAVAACGGVCGRHTANASAGASVASAENDTAPTSASAALPAISRLYAQASSMIATIPTRRRASTLGCRSVPSLRAHAPRSRPGANQWLPIIRLRLSVLTTTMPVAALKPPRKASIAIPTLPSASGSAST